MNPSPFEMGKSISDTIGKAQRRQGDLSAIDEILMQANESGNPQDVNKAMQQILSRVSPERQPAAIGILQNKMAEIQGQQQEEANVSLGFPSLFGKASPEAQKGYAKSMQPSAVSDKPTREETRKALEEQGYDANLADLPVSVANKVIADDIKREEKNENLENALSRLNRMRAIAKKKNIGRGSAGLGLVGGETTKDREEYEQLGKSLISFATTIPIRNRLEFEVLSEKLRNPSMTLAGIKGVLDSMESIIKGSMSEKKKTTKKQLERPPIEDFDL